MRPDKGQVGLMMAGHAGQPLHEAGADVPGGIVGRHASGRVDAGVDRRAGEQVHQRLQHVLRATDLIEPIMHQGCLHSPRIVPAGREIGKDLRCVCRM